MKEHSTPLFQPGLHQKLTEACRAASPFGEGFVVRRKGVSVFMEVIQYEVDWTQNVNHATRFMTREAAEMASRNMLDEVVPFSEAMVF